MAAVPWSKEYFLARLTAGQDNYIPLGTPTRGFINKLLIMRNSGVGFTADLYNSERAMPAAAVSDSAAGEEVFSAELYKIRPTITAAGAVYEDWTRYAYQNQDVKGKGRPEGIIYLRLNPTGSGTVDFQIALTIESVTFF